VIALLAALSLAAPADCAQPHDVDRYQLLRRLSLDLRGRVPSVEEYAALDGAGDVPRQTIQAWLKTNDFRAAMRRYHEAMFWPNVTRVRLNDQNNSLTALQTAPGLYVASQARQKLYRTASDQGCGDFQQASFDAAYPGEFRPDPAAVTTITTAGGATAKQEGWRLVTPYWDSTVQIKVCAFDAQEGAQAKLPNGQTVSCASKPGEGAAGCGCGPGLRWCYGPAAKVSVPIQQALREQLARAVDGVSVGGRPYSDLLLATDADENGPIAFWRKNLAPHYSLNQTFNAPDPGAALADRDFTDATWASAQRPALHAGVLTLPGYLLRFQTDRGRANRFRINFLCSYFTPPDRLEDSSGGQCQDNAADITQRCNCRYCHAVLEPLSAYFGLFSMAGTTLMTDPAQFPRTNAACKGSGSQFCTRFYVTQADAHNAGALQPFQFSDLHPEIVANIEGGPRLLAKQAIDTGQLAQCTVRKLWVELMGDEIYLPDAPATPRLDQLSKDFAGQGYSLPWLVEQIVTTAGYRRAR
jgi:hypothetical protein